MAERVRPRPPANVTFREGAPPPRPPRDKDPHLEMGPPNLVASAARGLASFGEAVEPYVPRGWWAVGFVASWWLFVVCIVQLGVPLGFGPGLVALVLPTMVVLVWRIEKYPAWKRRNRTPDVDEQMERADRALWEADPEFAASIGIYGPETPDVQDATQPAHGLGRALRNFGAKPLTDADRRWMAEDPRECLRCAGRVEEITEVGQRRKRFLCTTCGLEMRVARLDTGVLRASDPIASWHHDGEKV